MAGKPIEVVGVQTFSRNIHKLMAVVSGPGIDRALMQGGFVVERSAKENIRSQHLIDTGNLRSSIRTVLFRHGQVIVGTNVVYAAIHEFGGTITPKNAKWLVFKIGDQWVMTDSVDIPARPYLRPALDKNRRNVVKKVRETLNHEVMRTRFKV
jgi:phage gpG-like protein